MRDSTQKIFALFNNAEVTKDRERLMRCFRQKELDSGARHSVPF